MMLHVVVMKATVKSGEVYVFGVVLLRVVKQFLALGCVYALALCFVLVKLILHLKFLGVTRTCPITSLRILMARR